MNDNPALNLPPIELQVDDGSNQVFDRFRRKWVTLTPEEWVRQHFIHYLTTVLDYPPGLTAVEAPIRVYGKQRRCDAVIYGLDQQPRVIVECKAPHVTLDDAVFQQISSYNLALKAPYLMITNGMVHYCLRIDFEKLDYDFLDEIPAYADLTPGS